MNTNNSQGTSISASQIEQIQQSINKKYGERRNTATKNQETPEENKTPQKRSVEKQMSQEEPFTMVTEEHSQLNENEEHVKSTNSFSNHSTPSLADRRKKDEQIKLPDFVDNSISQKFSSFLKGFMKASDEKNEPTPRKDRKTTPKTANKQDLKDEEAEFSISHIVP